MANIVKPRSTQTKKYKPMTKATIIVISIVGALLLMSASAFAYQVYIQNTSNDDDGYYCTESEDMLGGCPDVKPVIYLYPTKKQDVKVELDYHGTFTTTYPDYNYSIKGWNVIANPDGSLVSRDDNKEYSYLFWEGVDKVNYTRYKDGFVIKGSDTKNFLQSTLSKIGLTPKEYNEMIVYWLPLMQNNKYNFIHFAGKEYTDSAKLTITPKPDSILRVFMVTSPLKKYKSVPEQEISTFARKGFTVVEWGGKQIK